MLNKIIATVFGLLLTLSVANAMSNNSLDEVKDITIKKTVTWYTTGKLDPTIIANNFVLNSPYYKNQDRAAFIKEFVDSDFYKKAVLDKLKKFDPLVILKSQDGKYFAIIAQYHTYSGGHAYETIFCTFNSIGQLAELRSIYDLQETKKAFQLK